MPPGKGNLTGDQTCEANFLSKGALHSGLLSAVTQKEGGLKGREKYFPETLEKLTARQSCKKTESPPKKIWETHSSRTCEGNWGNFYRGTSGECSRKRSYVGGDLDREANSEVSSWEIGFVGI